MKNPPQFLPAGLAGLACLAGLALGACATGQIQPLVDPRLYTPSIIQEDGQGGASYQPGGDYRLAWADEFQGGSLNRADWSVEILAPGHYNQELQAYVDSPDTLAFAQGGGSDGYLSLRALKLDQLNQAGSYASARINSYGKREFQYGKIVARMRLPYGLGIWPAFWMLGHDFGGLGGSTFWPECGEVDIMEFFGGSTLGDDKSLAALHGPGYSGDFPDKAVYTNPSGAFAGSWHIFEIEWSENRVTHLIDGHAFHTSSPADVSGPWVYNQPFFLILNFAVGGFGFDPDASSVFPQSLDVDWVRVYQRP